uniref:J domain-containing protein n=1 Tax=mine drainage metagenome TaxID=410659 RepID=E6QF49_9ZZZZ
MNGRGRSTKSIQGIYRRLVSAVHPDREADPILRAQKTALMEPINQASGKMTSCNCWPYSTSQA